MMGAEVEGWLFLKNTYVATFKLQVSITFSYAGELVSSRLHVPRTTVKKVDERISSRFGY